MSRRTMSTGMRLNCSRASRPLLASASTLMSGVSDRMCLMPLLTTVWSSTINILIMRPEEQYAVRALKNGASGYLTKDSAHSELIDAIRKISSGRKYITASLAERLAGMLDINIEQSQHEKLSNRELEVMLLIAAGNSMTGVADALNLSIKTVSTYKSRILEKMDLRSTADIIRYAIKNNLSY